jgi:hypothetical protein
MIKKAAKGTFYNCCMTLTLLKGRLMFKCLGFIVKNYMLVNICVT